MRGLGRCGGEQLIDSAAIAAIAEQRMPTADSGFEWKGQHTDGLLKPFSVAF